MIIKKTQSEPLLLVVLGFIVLAESLYIILSVGKKQVTPVTPPPAETVFCTTDAMLCPDGSYVGRVAPNCDFAPCPSQTPDTDKDKTIEGSFCAGIAGTKCPEGYKCIVENDYPDASGKCRKQ